MDESPPTARAELPSSRRLLKATLIALAVAAVLLVTVVLPAEYGVDPTGIGRVLGLKEMGDIKMRLAREAETADSLEGLTRSNPGDSTRPSTMEANPSAPAAVAVREDSAPSRSANTHVTEIVLEPNEGKEIKLVMRKGTRVSYSWSTDRGVVNYDTHADAPGIRYHGYAKGTGKSSDNGVLVAAFDGAHGWFWRNRGSGTVTVTLRTTGDYQELKRM